MSIDSSRLNLMQQCALKLIQNDLSVLYTTVITKLNSKETNNYFVMMFPYIGTIIDGTEDWIKKVNKSSNSKTDIISLPLFTEQEQDHYETMRNSIKFFTQDYDEIYQSMQFFYNESDKYFGSLCKPIANKLKVYDIYGVDTINGIYSGNTILCSLFCPHYSFGNYDGELLKDLSVIGGKYISGLNATNIIEVNKSFVLSYKDYGGFIKSPIGNDFSDKFVLFSILCCINYVLLFIDRFFVPEISTKFRFTYLLYYSLVGLVPKINEKLNTNFSIDYCWYSEKFRNAMAHYGLGVCLNPNELIIDDPMFGLTNKCFCCSYSDVKKCIIKGLSSLATQIEKYIGLNNFWAIKEKENV